MTPTDLKRTSLYSEHQKLKARLVPFSGFEMPVQYSGLIDEHLAVRQACGVFDVSHMGLLKISGPDARIFLDHSLTRNFSTLQPGKGAYTLLCRETGNTVDDLIVYCTTEQEFYAVLNAGNKEKDLEYLRSLKGTYNVQFEKLFDEYGILALQGPKTWQILQEACSLKAPFQTKPENFTFWKDCELFGKKIMIAVTGYTGESGCEMMIKNSDIVPLFQELLKRGENLGLKPAGLGARDTLRTEMGYSLYGHELSESINPIEAGLSWAIGFKKESFVGKEALVRAKAKPERKLVSLKINSKQAPRAEMKVKDKTGQEVGHITSGTFAPSLGYSIGLALVKNGSQGPYYVDIRGKDTLFEECQRPFYKPQI